MFTIETSWRYGVIGLYRDRFDVGRIYIYPVPFVRIGLRWQR